MTFDGSDRKQVRAREKELKIAEGNRLAYTRRVMQDTPGRKWMHDLLTRCHIWSTAFAAGQPDTTAFRLGEQNLGLQIFADVIVFPKNRFAGVTALDHAQTRPAALVASAETPDQSLPASVKRDQDHAGTRRLWESFPRETPVAVCRSLGLRGAIPQGALLTPGVAASRAICMKNASASKRSLRIRKVEGSICINRIFQSRSVYLVC